MTVKSEPIKVVTIWRWDGLYNDMEYKYDYVINRKQFKYFNSILAT